MDVMLVGGISPVMRKLILKLYKEGHRIHVLSGTRNPAIHYEHVFERYDFPYDSASVEEVFKSVDPDVTILLGAFDGNYTGEDPRKDAVSFTAGVQNILLSWATLKKGRLIYISSSEVYGSSYQKTVSESVSPLPRGIRPIMLYQGEETVRFYQEKLKKDAIIVRVDRIHDVPQQQSDIRFGIVGSMCLNAFRKGTVSYRRNHFYGLTYLGDVIEALFRLVTCKTHEHGLYNISSSVKWSEEQIAQAIRKYSQTPVEILDVTVDEHRSVVLDNQRVKEEFGFEIFQTPEVTVEKTLKYMHAHSTKFLTGENKGGNIVQRLYYRTVRMLGALVPYMENLICFIPFFMLNNRAVGSQYFSKIDFYLLYVLLFAVVHGQRQATFSALLATAGYMFRQMYGKTGLMVVTDYNTYVWVAEIFILGLVVGYMKDQIRFMQEEKVQEVDFLSERVHDIADINDSNLRVKEGLITQVVNYDNSLGTIYDMIEQLEADHPAIILFRAMALLQKLMGSQDVSLYRINDEQYGRLFGYTSVRAASLGSTLHIPDETSMYEAFEKQEVYLNREMNPRYPVMAYCLYENEKMSLAIMLWSIPFERMTIDESNRFIVIGKLIQKAVRQSAAYLDLLKDRRYEEGSPALQESAFEEYKEVYRTAGSRNLCEYSLLRVLAEKATLKETSITIGNILRETDRIGYGNDGTLQILLTSTDQKGCEFVRRRLHENGIETEVMEEKGLL